MTNIGFETYSRLVNEKQFNKLSSADRFAIAIAKENTYFCNSNDKPVRNACELLNVRYSGLLGILGRAYIKKHMSAQQLNNLLDLLASDQTSSFLNVSLITAFKAEMFDTSKF